MPGDEEIQRVTGEVSLLYVFQQLPAPVQQRLLPAQAAALIARQPATNQLHSYRDRDYGVAFEMPAAAIEQLLRVHEVRDIFLLRHLLNFLVCWVGFMAFYTLAARRFGSWRVGLLGTLLLVLSPRLFGDYFYNSKDAVFLACFTLAVAAAVPFIERPTWRWALACAAACALAIDVRLMGVLVPAATLFFIAWRALRGEYGPGQSRRLLGLGGLFAIALAVLVVAGWPYLWEAPLHNFLVAWRNMSHFRTLSWVLYRGQLLRANHLPWHYVLGCIGVTVPLLYLLFFGVGVLAIGTAAVRRRARLYAGAEWQDLLFLGLAVAPVLAVIVLHSVLYNSWRQLYFLYPMLLLVALRGLVAAWHWPPPAQYRQYWQPVLGLGVAAALAVIAVRIVRLHPLETLYFNALAAEPLDDNYDADYWGMGTRTGLEWVLAHDARPRIRVGSPEPYHVVLAHQMLPPAAQQRLVVTLDTTQVDYYLHNLARHRVYSVRYTHPLHELWADNVHVLDIFRLTHPGAKRPTPVPRAASRAGE
jgi:hypothetical protein